MRAAEEATAGSTPEVELKELILATAADVSVGRLTELKVMTDEVILSVPAEVSTAAMTEVEVGRLVFVLSPGSPDIWTTADVELVSSTTLTRLLDISVGSRFGDCERVLGEAMTELVRELGPIV